MLLTLESSVFMQMFSKVLNVMDHSVEWFDLIFTSFSHLINGFLIVQVLVCIMQASLCRTWTNWTCWGSLLVVMSDGSASGRRALSASWMNCTAPGVNHPPWRSATSECWSTMLAVLHLKYTVCCICTSQWWASTSWSVFLNYVIFSEVLSFSNTVFIKFDCS